MFPQPHQVKIHQTVINLTHVMYQSNAKKSVRHWYELFQIAINELCPLMIIPWPVEKKLNNMTMSQG